MEPFQAEQEFEAVLEADSADGGIFIVVPFSVPDVYGTRGKWPVQATLDGFPHRTMLVPLGDGYHGLPIPKEVRRALGKTVGDTLRVALRHAPEVHVVSLPPDLAAALDATPAARTFFETLPRPDQRNYVRWLDGAKTPEGRTQRLATTLQRLRNGLKRA